MHFTLTRDQDVASARQISIILSLSWLPCAGRGLATPYQTKKAELKMKEAHRHGVAGSTCPTRNFALLLFVLLHIAGRTADHRSRRAVFRYTLAGRRN